MTDTIFALATAAGRAAVAVIRLSGPASAEALKALAGRLPAARRASVRSLKDQNGQILDQALVLWFPAPASYTGEDCAELHLHGGTAIVESVSARLLSLSLRPAEPGEFTRRAFEHGKLDLAQAEAVADLIDAETTAQARQALDQLGGALSARHEAWREALIEALAFLEAAVDFPDEDVPESADRQARGALQRLLAELDCALQDQARGQRVREGYRIAVIGAPNAGKSSVFNALIAREAAIVTPAPGTTRDVIEAPLVIAGYKALLADTAGVRNSVDEIEREGVRRARRWAEDADLRLWVIDSSASDDSWRDAAPLFRDGDIFVLNKIDLGEGENATVAPLAARRTGAIIAVSAKSGEGLTELSAEISRQATAALSAQDFPAITRARHAESLTEARDRLAAALAAPEAELAAEDVRLAARALARITGRIDAEEILGAVFAKFCIGK